VKAKSKAHYKSTQNPTQGPPWSPLAPPKAGKLRSRQQQESNYNHESTKKEDMGLN
jgi:hypothetical protein